MWTVKFRIGESKRFKFPIRTTEWGSINPQQEAATPTIEELKNQSLFGVDRWLGVDRLPSVAVH